MEESDGPADLPRPFQWERPDPLAPVHELSPSVAAAQFGIDVTEFEPARYVPPAGIDDPVSGTFTRLHADERAELEATLEQRYGEGAAQRLARLLEAWKESSDPVRPQPQWLERHYRTAFDIEAPVRERPDGPSPPVGPIDRSRTELLTDLYQLTLTFLDEHHSGRPTVFRGTRRETAACLFVQALDDPRADAFTVKASTALNVTLMEAPAIDFAPGVLFRFSVPARDLLCAVDQFRTADRPLSNEFHMRGGPLALPAASVIHAGVHSDIWQPLVRTIRQVETHDEIGNVSFHDDIFEFLELADEYGYRVGTEAGGDRLRRWLAILRQNAVYSQGVRRTIREFVDEIGDPDPDAAFWVDSSS